MAVFVLGRELAFPPVDLAEDGLLAIGGDLRPERLIRAYAAGIFPWYAEGEPILWHAPDPRTVLPLERMHVPRSLRRTLRRRLFRLTLDRAFREVVEACAQAPRPEQDGTWITGAMIDAYCRLHALGVAHSVEAWAGEELAGGLYGVSLGRAFFGESMFARRRDASKVALVSLVEQLRRWGFTLVDCQIHSEHLERFGAEDWPRARYMSALASAVDRGTRYGPWQFDAAV